MLYMKKIFTLFAACICCMAAFAQNNRITLYQDCNFTGVSSTLAQGNYTRFKMGIGNDALAGVRVPPGMKVIIYADDNFTGASLEIISDMPCLNQAWKFQTTSVRVFDVAENMTDRLLTIPNIGYGQVAIYNACSFGGGSKVLPPGTYTRFKTGLNNDDLSSIVIPLGMSVTLYSDDDFNGRSITLTSSSDCLDRQNFNKEMTSMIVNDRNSSFNRTNYYNSNNNNGYNNGNNGNYNNGNYNNTGQNAVMLFEQCDFRGRASTLAVGAYSNSNLFGMSPYSISSVRVQPGYRVELFTQQYYKGSTTVLTENESCLGSSFKGKVFSIRISRDNNYNGNYNGNNNNNNSGNTYNNNNYNYVTIFADGNYGGQSLQLDVNRRYNQADLGTLFKNISSIQIPAGYTVKVWENGDFSGTSRTLTGSYSSLGFIIKWNDRIGSLQVSR